MGGRRWEMGWEEMGHDMRPHEITTCRAMPCPAARPATCLFVEE
jgi:hypothetical protein